MSDKLILQVVGNPGAGKSEVCKHLADTYGFETILVSDLIRSYAARRRLPLHDRNDYKIAHTHMRHELGDDFVPETILATDSKRIAVDGIRVPRHVQTLRQHGSLTIALWCPVQIRYLRTLDRDQGLDKTDFEAFQADERAEYQNDDPFVQSTLEVMQGADYHIDAAGELAVVLGKVDARVAPLL
ncbi:MAG TPA: AAA family ATPase [Candidatus Saccharibacteria bacterium]|nr:AAA family ATPase [Candidatus Saccharibacteria bacterium]